MNGSLEARTTILDDFSVNGVQLRRPLCPPGSRLATTNWQEASRLEKEVIRAAMQGELAPRVHP